MKKAIRAGKSGKARALMRIPERYKEKALGTDKASLDALKAIQTGQTLFITGPCGSGKTHLALALMGEWFADRIEVAGDAIIPRGRALFIPAVELYLEIKNSWGGELEQEKAILDKYAGVDLLVLDDLGAEKVSDWSRTVLYLLIDRRYRDCKQTIITSNLSLQGISDALDDRIVSRLSEMGLKVQMPGKDWRLA